MSVGFPDWWNDSAKQRAKALRIEDVMIARFDGVMSGVECVYWMPTDEETQQVLFDDSEAFLRIYRLDGEIDLEERRIIHRVQFAAIHEDRDVASDILAFVLWVIYAYSDISYVTMPDSSKVAVKFLRETQGPFLDPQQIRDARLVRVTVELETPWPKGMPDPRKLMDM